METVTPPMARHRPRLTLWLLRIVLTLHVLAVLAQPLLAGMFLTGDIDAITAHGIVGTRLAGLDLLLVIPAAVAYAVVVRGRWWVPAAAAAMFLLVGVQIGWGYERELQWHVPGAVAVVVASLLFAFWAWTPAAGRSAR